MVSKIPINLQLAVLAIVFANTLQLAAVGMDGEAPTIVTLYPTAQVHSPLVRIDDVAEITGGSAALREEIAELDLARRPDQESTARVTRGQVAVRLRLAGIPADIVQVRGAAETRLNAAQPKDAAELATETIRLSLAEQWQLAPQDLQVTLLRQVPEIARAANQSSGIRLRHMPSTRRLGQVSLQLSVPGKDGNVRTVVVPAEIRRKGKVVVAVQPIKRGAVIRDVDVQTAERWVADESELVDGPAVVGSTARVSFEVGQVVRTNEILRRRVVETHTVNARDVVRLVARKGNLTVVVANAVALQKGNVGDVIRVRNPMSDKIVTGHVVSSQEVAVRF